MDAARKGLILARLLGYRGAGAGAAEPGARPLAGRSRLDQFFAKLPSFDKEWADRAAREEAQGTGAALRRDGDAAVGVGEARRGAGVEPDGCARGHAQPDRLHDAPLRSEPLVVSGPGAGPAVTAAGILNDIYSLAGR